MLILSSSETFVVADVAAVVVDVVVGFDGTSLWVAATSASCFLIHWSSTTKEKERNEVFIFGYYILGAAS